MNSFSRFLRGTVVTVVSILLFIAALGAVFVILGATTWGQLGSWLRTTALILAILGGASIVIAYLTTSLKK